MLSGQQILNVIGRQNQLFDDSLFAHQDFIQNSLEGSRILVIGAAGSIGSSVAKLLCQYKPSLIHLLDINENALATLVRELRVSSALKHATELKTFLIDISSLDFFVFASHDYKYDYVFNLSAVKHVRSENNVYSLARMIRTNIIATCLSIKYLSGHNLLKYFCVSTDKAANPVNLMGFTKLIMEDYAFNNQFSVPVSSARFANVAFSNGSLLESFLNRYNSRQPLVIPANIRRFFISKEESASICLFSALSCGHRQILVPNDSSGLCLQSFEQISKSFLSCFDYLPEYYNSFELASRHLIDSSWPVYVSHVDTTGEKPYEEFVSASDSVISSPYPDLDIVEKESCPPPLPFDDFMLTFDDIMKSSPCKSDLVSLLTSVSPALAHSECGKYLDDKI